MALGEEQILRYSRQILLSEVGGSGQAKLLSTGVLLSGWGPSQDVAAAYLGAGGTPVSCDRRCSPSDEEGFLLRSAGTEGELGGAWLTALTEANPDATQPCATRGALGEAPAQFEGPAPWVALGWAQQRGAVIFRSQQGCADCFRAALESFGPGPTGAESVLLGALGALAFQRLVLELSPPLGGFWVQRGGAISPMEMNRCPACL